MKKRQIYVLLTGLLVSAGAHAQQTPDLVADEVVVTASRFEESYIDKPVSVTVISSEEIRRSPARTVPELLSYQAGIGSRDLFGNNGSQATIDMRGFGVTAGQNVLVLIDGRRQNDIDLSGVQWSAIPLDFIERIEIVRGSGSVLYGDGAVSGVVNIITRKPGKDGNRASVTVGGGTFDTYTARVDGELGQDTTGLRVGASYFDSQGYRENNRNIQSTAFADGKWSRGNDDFSLRFAGANQNLRLPGGRLVQPALGVNQLETDRRGTATPDDYALRDDVSLQFDWTRKDGSLSEIVGLSYRRKEQKSYFAANGSNYRDADLDVFSATPRLRFDQSDAAVPGTLVVGLDWYVWDYHLAVGSSPASIVQPIHQVDATQQNRAIYALETIQVGTGTTITGGARVEWFHIDATDTFDPTAPNPAFLNAGSPQGEQSERQHALELGLRQALNERWSSYGRGTRAYRFATVDEIYESSVFFPGFVQLQEFQFLQPQTSETYELGIDWHAPSANARLAVFQMDVKNEIHLDPFTAGTGNTNLPPSRRRGIEFEVGARPVERIDLHLTYTYTEAKFQEGAFPGGPFTPTNISFAGKSVPLVPRHRANFAAGFRLSEHARFDAVTSYVSDQFMDNDEENSLGTKIPGYTVTDVRLAYETARMSVGLLVSNLFDRDYYNYAVKSQFTPGNYSAYSLPGRNALLELKVKFD